MSAKNKKITPLRALQFHVEYALVRMIDWLVGLLPECAAVKLGVAGGWLFWLLSPFRRRVARRNIELAMPGRYSGRELSRLVRAVFINIGLTAVESIWMRRHISRQNIEQRFPVDGVDVAQNEIASGRGAIAFIPHLGNWELFGGIMAVRTGGITALARPTNNPLVGQYTTRLREQYGINVLSTRDGARPLVAALRNKQPLAVLIDQHVNRAFVPVKFFGRHAATTAVVATLALRMNIPVFAAYSLREGRSFRHHGYIFGPLELIRTGDDEADVIANTQFFNDTIEAVVREHPDQWLWTHRRWKLAERMAKETQTKCPTK